MKKFVINVVCAIFIFVSLFAFSIPAQSKGLGEVEMKAAYLLPKSSHRNVKVSSDSKRVVNDQNVTYKYNGIHWNKTKIPVSYYINPQNSYSIDQIIANGTISTAFDTWENDPGSYMDYNYSGSTSLKGPIYDQKNTVSFQSLNSSAVAVTYYWYYKNTRELVEFDIVFNEKYPWSVTDSGNSYSFDLQNVATHEIGHTLSLGDLYSTSTSELTMYGYASFGEIKKRDLGLGDRLGIKRIYPLF